MTRIALSRVVERLQAHFGVQKPPKLDGPWEMILWENVAYRADDERRQKAFHTLKKESGRGRRRFFRLRTMSSSK
jgi:hypothetical protein